MSNLNIFEMIIALKKYLVLKFVIFILKLM